MTLIQDTLRTIQQKLKAPKNQENTFGGYKYRSCEDILESVKPYLGECILILSDSLEFNEGRAYVHAKATLLHGPDSLSASGYAREPIAKKGMDDSQLTGAASSYARKYALNGLFCIDDTKDADTQDNTDMGVAPHNAPAPPASGELPWLTDNQYNAMLLKIEAGEIEMVKEKMKNYRMKKIFKSNLLEAITLHEQTGNEEVNPDDIPF